MERLRAALKKVAAVDAPVLLKGPTGSGKELAARAIQALVIAGPQSEHCVRATVLGALARGLHVTLVANGHSTYDGGGRTAAAIRDAVNAEFARRVEIVRAGEP